MCHVIYSQMSLSKRYLQQARTIYESWRERRETKCVYGVGSTSGISATRRESWLIYNEKTGMVGCKLSNELAQPGSGYTGNKRGQLTNMKSKPASLDCNDITRHITSNIHREALYRGSLRTDGEKIQKSWSPIWQDFNDILPNSGSGCTNMVTGTVRPTPTAFIMDLMAGRNRPNNGIGISPQKKHQMCPQDLTRDECLQLFIGNLRSIVKTLMCLGSSNDLNRDIQWETWHASSTADLCNTAYCSSGFFDDVRHDLVRMIKEKLNVEIETYANFLSLHVDGKSDKLVMLCRCNFGANSKLKSSVLDPPEGG